MSEYLLINILTIIFSLLLSFENKIKFYKNYVPLFISVFVVGGVFILWDIIATYRGDWDFNPIFLMGQKIFGLPFEEILFFITVPYASLFLYETGNFYLGNHKLSIKKLPLVVLALLSFLVGAIYHYQYYTLTIMFSFGLFFIANLFEGIRKLIVCSRLYWLWISFTFIPFLIVNYFLTSLPIVNYSDRAIWGFRFITIPIEDFFYSFSMLSFYLIVYLLVKEKWTRAKRLQ